MFRRGVVSRVTAKLVCALLLKYYYSTIGYDVICFIMGSLVLYRLGQLRKESTGFRGTRTVLIPENREPNIQLTRIVPIPGNREANIQGTRTVPVPGSGEPNIQGTRMEWFWISNVR